MFYTFNLGSIRKKLLKWMMLLAVAGGLVFATYTVFNLFYPIEHMELIIKYSEEYGVEPALICAIINAESRFDREAVSRKGASGLMQIIPNTADWGAEEIGIEGYSYDRIFEPEINIQLGCWYIAKLLAQYNGERDTAIAAYNAGSGTVSRWLLDPLYSSDGRTLSVIPYKETDKYVRKVENYIKVYDFILDYRLDTEKEEMQ